MAVFLWAFFLGWGLGVNDGANIFAPATSARIIRRRDAGMLAAAFVLLGAVMYGARGVHTLAMFASGASSSAAVIAISAAAAVWLMAAMGLPSSVTQAVVGAMIGVQLGSGAGYGFAGGWRILGGWLLSPVFGAAAAWLFDRIFQKVAAWRRPSVFMLDSWVRAILAPVSCYGAWALGANNTANVAAVVRMDGRMSLFGAVLFGGVCIALGALRPSRRVANTVGGDIVRLDSVGACTAVAAQASAMNVFALLGLPVSATQTMVGAVIGIGLSRGLQTVRWKRVTQVFGGWFFAPVTAGVLGVLGALLVRIMDSGVLAGK